MTDGSVLGDLANEKSPRHDAAALMFQREWDGLADRDTPPMPAPDRPVFIGDLCKVRGEALVWNGIEWVKLEVGLKLRIPVPPGWTVYGSEGQ